MALMICILVVQNFLLVKKVDSVYAQMQQLQARMDRLSTMNPGDHLGKLTMLNLDGELVAMDPTNTHRSSSIVFVFTTWCTACLDNIDNWVKLYQGLNPRGLSIYGVSPDPIEDIIRYKDKLGIPFPMFSVSNDSTSLTTYKWKSYPQTILLDSLGEVVRVWNGGLRSDDYDEIVRVASSN